MQTQAEPRFRHRIPCSLSIGGRQHSALVLNVSNGGLFVRTTAVARRGDAVEIDLPLERNPAPVGLRAQVVWHRVAHSAARLVADGGLGLRLTEPPQEYRAFLGGLAGTEAPASGASGPIESAAPEPPAAAGEGFEVRMKQRGGPRSRCMRVAANDEADAREAGLASAGEGWEVLEVRRRSR